MIYRLAWMALAVLAVIVVVCIFLPKFNRHRELKRRREELRAEIRDTENQTRELRLKQERFANEAEFVERTARQMGMIHPDETVFEFTNEQSSVENQKNGDD